MTATTSRHLKLGGSYYPVVLPSLRDPRLHLAAVIVSIHILGQTLLGFRVSIPQILVAILTCAAMEVAIAFRTTRQIVWPASAMLTGSGVALILRLVDAERGDHWSWRGWHLFAGVAAFSLLSKYALRFRGTHLFNPSNVGLVAAFLILGSSTIEPLDFWWAPLRGGMIAAYLIIVAGGVLITRRLGLLTMAVTFWVALAAALGVLAASGHCITAAWAITPVCGSTFWRVVVTSPEVLIFLFFMITDPKTIPLGARPRVGFALSIAVASTLLLAPWSTEFGAKVGLLAGLVVLTPFRHLYDRWLGSEGWAATQRRLMLGSPRRVLARGAILGSLAVLLGVAIQAAGAPAQLPAAAGTAPVIDIEVDPAAIPPVAVSPEAASLNATIADDPQVLGVALARALLIEGEAMRRADTSVLRAADDGERLLEMEQRVQGSSTLGRHTVVVHEFETLTVDVVFTDGPQGGASLAVRATGWVDEIEYGQMGEEVGRNRAPLDSVFVLRPTDDHWVIVAETPAGA